MYDRRQWHSPKRPQDDCRYVLSLLRAFSLEFDARCLEVATPPRRSGKHRTIRLTRLTSAVVSATIRRVRTVVASAKSALRCLATRVSTLRNRVDCSQHKGSNWSRLNGALVTLLDGLSEW